MNGKHRWNRRRWISSAATAAGAAAMLPGRGSASFWRVFGTGAGGPVRDAVEGKLKEFPLSQVRLRRGIFLDQLESNQSFVESLPNDRLLHTFRLTAGMASTADPLGGWEHPRIELRGHFAGGHVLSACALLHAATGDDAIKQKGNVLVSELAKCQEKLNQGGYLSAYPTSFYDRLKEGKHVWAPFYTYHKILAGHLDMYTLCGNEQALGTAEKMAEWVAGYLKPIPDEQWAKMQMVEFGGMEEALFNLYALTGKEQHLELARRFDHKKFFDALAEGKDELNGLHANTNIPKVIGAARGYELTGEQRYHDIANYFWHEVVSERTYCTGGTSNGEGWHGDPGKFAGQLGEAAEECCCGYNMLKLTRHLFRWTGEPATMDYYERTLFNSRLGTQDTDGLKMYYVSLMPGLWRTFGTRFDSFWCCTGTGAEEFGKFGDTIYFHDGQGLYVNLFIASELTWPEKKVTVVQETNFPEEEGTTITFKSASPVRIPLHLRTPYWATRGVTVSINGKKQDVTARPSSYFTLDRTWNDGDKIQLDLPMGLHLAPLPDEPTMQAAMYGPLVLAGRLGTRGLTHEHIYGPLGPDEARDIPVPPLTGSVDAPDWVEQVKGQTLEFQTVGQKSEIDVSPFYQVNDERYTVYWKVNRKTA